MSPLRTPEDDGLLALGTRLAMDGRRLAQAEIALAKSRMAVRLADAKGGLVLIVAAAVLALGAVGALLVGLIVTLAPRIGPGWATLVVTVAALGIAGTLGMVGARRLGRVAAPAEALR